MLSTDRLSVPSNSDTLKRARNASKRKQHLNNQTSSLNNSLNESIKSFEKIYNAANQQQDIYTTSAKKSGYIFEESELSPEKQPFHHRRLSSFGRLKQNLEINTSVQASKIKLENSTNTSIYCDKKDIKETSAGLRTTKNDISAKRQSLKATISSISSSRYAGMKAGQLNTPNSAQIKQTIFAYREPKSMALKPKPSKIQKYTGVTNKKQQLVGKYDDLNDKLAEVVQMVDTLAFETHFAAPEMIGETDKFRKSMNEALKQMQNLVQSRSRVVASLCNKPVKPSTETIF
jgi:hypothetical protein